MKFRNDLEAIMNKGAQKTLSKPVHCANIGVHSTLPSDELTPGVQLDYINTVQHTGR